MMAMDDGSRYVCSLRITLSDAQERKIFCWSVVFYEALYGEQEKAGRTSIVGWVLLNDVYKLAVL